MDSKAIADALFVEVEKYVNTRTTEIASALEALQGQIKELSERKPIDGKDGRDGIDGKDGANGIDGKDGRDGIDGKDGTNGAAGANGADGKDGANGVDGQKGADGRDGIEGEPGRDAIHIDVLDGIDSAKKYQRGTFAAFRGGIVRSFRGTDPLPEDGDLEKHGWHVVVRGIAGFDVEADDDLRTFTVRSVMTDGHKESGSFRTPTMKHVGIWKDDNEYKHGDVVTSGGSMWLAEKDAPKGRPGNPGSDWKLIVKKGRDGSDK